MMYGLYNNGYDGGWMSPYYGGPGLAGGLIMFLFCILVIFLIVWLIRMAIGHRHGRWGSHSLEILKERYARGEINKEEFETKKRDLMNSM